MILGLVLTGAAVGAGPAPPAHFYRPYGAFRPTRDLEYTNLSPAYTAEGRLVAVACALSADLKESSEDKVRNYIKIYDAWRGLERGTILAHPQAIRVLVFAPDSRYLLSAGADKTARLWAVASGQQVGAFKGHTGEIFAAAFSPDGKLLATRSSDGTLRVWDVATAKEVAQFPADPVPGEILFTPDGKQVAAAGPKSFVLWEVARPDAPLPLKGKPASSSAMTLSPDGRMLATALADKTVRLWDLENVKELAALKGHDGEVNQILFMPDGKKVFTASADATVKVWDPATGKELMTLKEHREDVLAMRLSVKGTVLASYSPDLFALWDPISGKLFAKQAVKAGRKRQAYDLSPDGIFVLEAGANVTLWDTGLFIRGHR
jgi:WD40 repeat protein